MNVLNATKLYPLNWVILYYVNFTAIQNKHTGSHLNIKEKKRERERQSLPYKESLEAALSQDGDVELLMQKGGSQYVIQDKSRSQSYGVQQRLGQNNVSVFWEGGEQCLQGKSKKKNLLLVFNDIMKMSSYVTKKTR